jgi:cellulose synthase/poly-beta-1,6-N-acetylglucosamine synthase-like glycosyltransferase
MTDLEIPYERDRHWRYRIFEILPGTLTWTLLLLPFILSLINVTVAAIFVFAYLLIYFVRSVGVDIRALQGYRMMRQHQRMDWASMLKELEAGKVADPAVQRPNWHYDNILRFTVQPDVLKPSNILHAVLVATYNESREILEPTIQSLLTEEYNAKQIILVIAYEERGGPDVEKRAHELIAKYGPRFYAAMAFKHPKNIPGELIGKGGNVTHAGRKLQAYLVDNKIAAERVIVTSLDADNHPDKKYFAALSYVYAVYPDPTHVSIQPISIYNNNIWDAPAPMRVIATGNSFYNIVLALRPHMLRNFSSHAQSMKALIDTDFWSVRTIVEDGHQFWRSYFRYDGNYRVLPLYVPIYQDAVLTKGYRKTLKAQFIQLRRWTYGASDIAYVITQGFFKPNAVPKRDLLAKTGRLIEGHVTWAVAPLLCLFAGFIPALFHPQSYTANQLPIIVSNIQRVALVGGLASLFVAMKTLPPRPLRYRRHRTILMLVQWIYLPITTIAYGSFAAMYSQTRLMFGWYLDKFDVTEKAVVNEAGDTTAPTN